MDKLADCPALDQFLQAEPAATLAVPIDQKGTIHAATMLYWHSPEPLCFYFVTGRNTEKCNLLNTGAASIPAACVVGTTRDTKYTLQMRGQVSLADKTRHAKEVEQYYTKRGSHNDDVIDPENVLLKFTATWARYTDYDNDYKRTELDPS